MVIATKIKPGKNLTNEIFYRQKIPDLRYMMVHVPSHGWNPYIEGAQVKLCYTEFFLSLLYVYWTKRVLKCYDSFGMDWRLDLDWICVMQSTNCTPTCTCKT